MFRPRRSVKGDGIMGSGDQGLIAAPGPASLSLCSYAQHGLATFAAHESNPVDGAKFAGWLNMPVNLPGQRGKLFPREPIGFDTHR
jgi:hypothetical protein